LREGVWGEGSLPVSHTSRVPDTTPDIWAALPVKEFANAKQRLSPLLTPLQREALAATMLEDVLTALAGANLAGILVNTLDPLAAALAHRYGARIITDDARAGHTGAVAAMARALTREDRAGMLALPGDIPRVTAAEINALIAAGRGAPSFTIAPAHDELGSNGVLCLPPEVIPLRFGDNSYFPHLDGARRHGIEPTSVRLPGFALDIDHPDDLRAFLRAEPALPTRTLRFLHQLGLK
jgi:2-phospho-L-lactate/phosphoenolpyruvate guanylyltransferase